MSERKPKASDHESYNIYSLVSFLLPLVGIIMGAIMMTKDNKLDRKLGEHAIVMAIFGLIVAGIFWVVYVNWIAVQSIQQINY